MREIVGSTEEYFRGSRELGAQFLGTWELSKLEHFNLYLRNKGTTVIFIGNKATCNPLPSGGPQE